MEVPQPQAARHLGSRSLAVCLLPPHWGQKSNNDQGQAEAFEAVGPGFGSIENAAGSLDLHGGAGA